MKLRMSPKQRADGETPTFGRATKVIIVSIFIIMTVSAVAFGQCCRGPPPELSGSLAAPSNGSADVATIQVSDSQTVPDFTVPTLSGGDFSLRTARGKPVVLYFMAYWCPTCVPEARALGELHRKYGDRVSIVALDVDPSSTPARLQQFRSYAGDPTYTFAFDAGDRLARELGVRNLETNVFIDASGSISARVDHSLGYRQLVQEVERLLRQ